MKMKYFAVNEASSSRGKSQQLEGQPALNLIEEGGQLKLMMTLSTMGTPVGDGVTTATMKAMFWKFEATLSQAELQQIYEMLGQRIFGSKE